MENSNVREAVTAAIRQTVQERPPDAVARIAEILAGTATAKATPTAPVPGQDAQKLQNVGRLGAGSEAKGAVQAAMGQNTMVDSIWEDFCDISGVKGEFSQFLATLEKRPHEEKLVAVQTLVPLMRKRLNEDPEALSKKRFGILSMYRTAAEKVRQWQMCTLAHTFNLKVRLERA